MTGIPLGADPIWQTYEDLLVAYFDVASWERSDFWPRAVVGAHVSEEIPVHVCLSAMSYGGDDE